MDNSRCVILVPAGRHIEPHCEYSLRQLEAQGYPVRRLYGFAQIDVARNRLASEAVAEGFEELMWIDSDIAFEPRSVQRLRSHNLPFVCGLYPKKVEKAWSSQFLPGPADPHAGGGRGARRDPLCGHRLPARAAAGLPGGPAPAAAPVVPSGRRVRPRRRTSCPWSFPPAMCTSTSARTSRSPNAPVVADFGSIADTSIRLQHIGIYGYSWEDVGGGVARRASYEVKLEGKDRGRRLRLAAPPREKRPEARPASPISDRDRAPRAASPPVPPNRMPPMALRGVLARSGVESPKNPARI